MRKRLNTLRRRYQRTTSHEDFRAQSKAQYRGGKARYTSTIKNEKVRPWKTFCNITPGNNPWNELYKIAAGKKKTKVNLTTLKKAEGSQTKDTADTLQYMLEQFTPEDDNKDDDDDDRRRARAKSQLPIGMDNDKKFTVLVIRNAIES